MITRSVRALEFVAREPGSTDAFNIGPEVLRTSSAEANREQRPLPPRVRPPKPTFPIMNDSVSDPRELFSRAHDTQHWLEDWLSEEQILDSRAWCRSQSEPSPNYKATFQDSLSKLQRIVNASVTANSTLVPQQRATSHRRN